MNLGPIKRKYNNLIREEKKALYDVRNDTSIIRKEAGKRSVLVVWDKEDYLKETEEQLSCEEMYEEVTDRKRGDIHTNTLKYFDVEESKFDRFYLLPKIHKRFHSVTGRPVYSNSYFLTENISAFLDFSLKPIATIVKSYVRDTNDFLRKS